jgi:hypothetical protein
MMTTSGRIACEMHPPPGREIFRAAVVSPVRRSPVDRPLSRPPVVLRDFLKFDLFQKAGASHVGRNGA